MVGVAGALGALCRYSMGVAFGPTGFPWPTLAVNAAGSLLLDLVLAFGPGRLTESAVVVLSVGFLGAFTTFSTFGVETQALLRDGRAGAASAYVLLSVTAGVALAAGGWSLGRLLAR